jgi:hypothetical protein
MLNKGDSTGLYDHERFLDAVNLSEQEVEDEYK